MRQLLATLCVASPLALFALGSSDPTWRVSPKNLDMYLAHDNRGACFGYGSHIS
jgi:hypothetical protein